jgi:hypothetical protein
MERTALADPPATQAGAHHGLVGWRFYSLYPLLGTTPGIYRGVVTKYTVVQAAPADEAVYGTSSLEFGRVTFAITETLQGTSKSELSLPYSRKTEFLKGRPFGPWPWPDDIFMKPGIPLCIVVAPGDSPGPFPASDGVAHRVFIGSNEDPRFGWMADLIRISSFDRSRAGDRLLVLSNALTDANEEIRRYAVDALMNEFFEASPDEVIKALLTQVGRAMELKLMETGEFQGLLWGLNALPGATQVERNRRAAVRVLALSITNASSPLTEKFATEYLAASVTSHPFATPHMNVGGRRSSDTWKPQFRATEVLSAEEIDRLRATAAKLSADPDMGAAAKVVDEWLHDSGR